MGTLIELVATCNLSYVFITAKNMNRYFNLRPEFANIKFRFLGKNLSSSVSSRESGVSEESSGVYLPPAELPARLSTYSIKRTALACIVTVVVNSHRVVVSRCWAAARCSCVCSTTPSSSCCVCGWSRSPRTPPENVYLPQAINIIC